MDDISGIRNCRIVPCVFRLRYSRISRVDSQEIVIVSEQVSPCSNIACVETAVIRERVVLIRHHEHPLHPDKTPVNIPSVLESLLRVINKVMVLLRNDVLDEYASSEQLVRHICLDIADLDLDDRVRSLDRRVISSVFALSIRLHHKLARRTLESANREIVLIRIEHSVSHRNTPVIKYIDDHSEEPVYVRKNPSLIHLVPCRLSVQLKQCPDFLVYSVRNASQCQSAVLQPLTSRSVNLSEFLDSTNLLEHIRKIPLNRIQSLDKILKILRTPVLVPVIEPVHGIIYNRVVERGCRSCRSYVAASRSHNGVEIQVQQAHREVIIVLIVYVIRQ